MPLPENLTTRTVVGTFLTPRGNPAKGYVVFTPQVIVHNEETDELILPAPVKQNLDSTGSFSVELLDTDNADLSPNNWGYYVQYRVKGVIDNDFFTWVPAGNTDLSIADLLIVDPTEFTPEIITTLLDTMARIESAIAELDALGAGS